MKQQKQPNKSKPLWQLIQQNAVSNQIRCDQILPNHLQHVECQEFNGVQSKICFVVYKHKPISISKLEF